MSFDKGQRTLHLDRSKRPKLAGAKSRLGARLGCSSDEKFYRLASKSGQNGSPRRAEQSRIRRRLLLGFFDLVRRTSGVMPFGRNWPSSTFRCSAAQVPVLRVLRHRSRFVPMTAGLGCRAGFCRTVSKLTFDPQPSPATVASRIAPTIARSYKRT